MAFCVRADESYDYILEPSPVALPLVEPLRTRVVQVACGRAHSLVLTDEEGGKRHAGERNLTFSGEGCVCVHTSHLSPCEPPHPHPRVYRE